MPPSNGKRIIKVAFAMFALAGVLGALSLIERSSPALARDESINALPAAFTPGGDPGSAFSGSLESFAADQFSGADLSSLNSSQQSGLRSLFSVGQASSPTEALAKLQGVPNLGSLSGTGGQRSFFRAIAGDVFKTLRALFKNVPGALGDRMRRMLENMAGGFLGGGGGGGGGGTS